MDTVLGWPGWCIFVTVCSLSLIRGNFCREDGQIIRANVNGTREVILTESDVFYVSSLTLLGNCSRKHGRECGSKDTGSQEMKSTFSWRQTFKRSSQPPSCKS